MCKHIVIYAEWLDADGNFDNGFFYSWDDYHSKFFCPDVKQIYMQDCSYYK